MGHITTGIPAAVSAVAAAAVAAVLASARPSSCPLGEEKKKKAEEKAKLPVVLAGPNPASSVKPEPGGMQCWHKNEGYTYLEYCPPRRHDERLAGQLEVWSARAKGDKLNHERRFLSGLA